MHHSIGGVFNWKIEGPAHKSEQSAREQSLVHVLATDVELEPISPTNMVGNWAVTKEATTKTRALVVIQSNDDPNMFLPGAIETG